MGSGYACAHLCVCVVYATRNSTRDSFASTRKTRVSLPRNRHGTTTQAGGLSGPPQPTSSWRPRHHEDGSCWPGTRPDRPRENAIRSPVRATLSRQSLLPARGFLTFRPFTNRAQQYCEKKNPPPVGEDAKRPQKEPQERSPPATAIRAPQESQLTARVARRNVRGRPARDRAAALPPAPRQQAIRETLSPRAKGQ